MKTVQISEFKAKCIEQLKAVQATGEPVVVTRRHQPIAIIHPYRASQPQRRLGALKGRMAIHGDIVHIDSEDAWEMEA